MKNLDILLMGDKPKCDDGHYGYLYNFYALEGNSYNFISGLHVPTVLDWSTLITYTDSRKTGAKMKAVSNCWNSPNAGAADDFNAKVLPGGERYPSSTAVYQYVNTNAFLWSSTENGSTLAWYYLMSYNGESAEKKFDLKKKGCSIRCIRSLTASEKIIYDDGDVVESGLVDGDGNTYNLVRIGGVGWIDENIKTTKYLNGTSLTKVTSATAWTALTTEGYCAYDNDDDNV